MWPPDQKEEKRMQSVFNQTKNGTRCFTVYQKVPSQSASTTTFTLIVPERISSSYVWSIGRICKSSLPRKKEQYAIQSIWLQRADRIISKKMMMIWKKRCRLVTTSYSSSSSSDCFESYHRSDIYFSAGATFRWFYSCFFLGKVLLLLLLFHLHDWISWGEVSILTIWILGSSQISKQLVASG